MALASCSNSKFNLDKIAPGYSQAFSAINTAVFGNNTNNITPELIDQIPYASMLVKIGQGPYGLMILQSLEGDISTWVSGDGVYLVLKKGKIIKTAGLINNLTRLNTNYFFESSDYPNLFLKETYKYYYSFDPPQLRNLEVHATYDKTDFKKEALFNKKMKLSVIEENIVSEQINWRAKNKYWVDENSYIWKSEQQISPKLPVIYIEITKKPR